jgi:hypothetical protein
MKSKAGVIRRIAKISLVKKEYFKAPGTGLDRLRKTILRSCEKY